MPDSELADPAFATPDKVDLICGAGFWATILKDQMHKIKDPPDTEVVVQDTELGNVIFGKANNVRSANLNFHLVTDDDEKLDTLMENYWNADKIPEEREWIQEEDDAENAFVNSFSRSNDGRYVVTIPRKRNFKEMGNSSKVALACFLSLERKFEKIPELLTKYKAVFDDYIATGHMLEVKDRKDDEGYFLPHHAINHLPGSKGKFRVVFNASATSSNGVSFNDQQLAGPKLQRDLTETFLRFRTNKFAMIADIKQMYRQVRIHPNEYDYQKVFWRASPHDDLKVYAITVISWGMTSAGFNAVRAMRQCAVDESPKFPLGAEVALNDFYFDDMLSGADSEEELIKKFEQISKLLNSAGFELSKYATSSAKLRTVVQEDSLTEIPTECGVLGMIWNPHRDLLRVKIDNWDPNMKVITKRNVASGTAKVYDPSGLVLPVIVSGKILQQNIWRSKIGWDKLLPEELQSQWLQFCYSVFGLSKISIPRWLGCSQGSFRELHVFCDASELSTGAVAYLTSRNGHTIESNIITSRSQVAPTKPLSIPKLELKAAVLASELMVSIKKLYSLDSEPIYMWSDSTIVLQWIRKNPNNCTTFVSNRVSKIQNKTSGAEWGHVPGIENPADLLTRGMTSAALEKSQLWWSGPPWLKDSKSNWPRQDWNHEDVSQCLPKDSSDADGDGTMVDVKSKSRKFVGIIIHSATRVIKMTEADGAEQSLLNRHSKLGSLLRVTAYIFRFIKNLKNSVELQKKDTSCVVNDKCLGKRRRVSFVDNSLQSVPPITAKERREALNFWVMHTQELFYDKEIKACRQGSVLPRDSSVLKLSPILDANNILRVGGRLQFAKISYDTRHQIILPPQSRLTSLIIKDAHSSTLHGGPQLMIAHLRRTFWINRLRQLCKSVVHHCPRCIRFDQKAPSQLMGQLPAARVNDAEPFDITGLDFCGPFSVRRKIGRPTKSSVNVDEKAWIIVFVCLASKAVHVDVVISLAIEHFMAAFEKFIFRKGRCFELWSDNGTTFIGTNNELSRILKSWSANIPPNLLAQYNTEWKFITPRAPHQGGIWEAAVKQVKRHLKRSIGNQVLTLDELTHLTVQIEGCLNSRPLWPCSDDPSDLRVLTPALLCMGKPILSQPLAEYVVNIPDNRLTWWRKRQKLIQELWHSWKEDYLVSLQQRNKWFDKEPNIKLMDMVVIRDEILPPASWLLGRVVKLHLGKDGLVRSACIKTENGEFERPITKLCILLPEENVKDP